MFFVKLNNMSPVKQKIMLLLLAGLALGFTHNPYRQWKIVKGVSKEWNRINEKKLRDEIRQLYQSKLIGKKENSDGSCTLSLTEKGKLKALTYHFEKMKIERKDWDGKWRFVSFDIPEKIKRAREALREKLRTLGFCELQKSVFVFPYDCKNEIDFVIEFFNLRRHVRFGILEYLDNELDLKKTFRLL